MAGKEQDPRRSSGRGRIPHLLAGFTEPRQNQGSVEQQRDEPVAAHVFSGRFLLAVAVLAFIAIAAYAPLSTFLKQQAEINQVKAHISQLEAENKDLQTQLDWWNDDNYVKQQARNRLYYVTEGETAYLVVGQDHTSEVADDTSAAAKTAPQKSWTIQLWNSFQRSALDGQQTEGSASSGSN